MTFETAPIRFAAIGPIASVTDGGLARELTIALHRGKCPIPALERPPGGREGGVLDRACSGATEVLDQSGLSESSLP